MKQSKYLVFALLAGVVFCAGARPICAETTWYVDDDGNANEGTRARALQLFSASPAAFIENTGQIGDPSVRYVFYGNGANIFHTTDGPVFQVFQRVNSGRSERRDPLAGPDDRFRQERETVTESCSFSATFPGAKKVQPVGHDPQKAKINYYIGNDPRNWRVNVPTYSTVVYPDLYDGIDLYTYGRRRHLKYEFCVAPGADYSKIIVKYSGIDGLFIDADGALHVKTPLGELVDNAPYIYQVIDGRKVKVAGGYRVIDGVSYTFDITGKVDATKDLVIDPDLVWASFLGGSDMDFCTSLDIDAEGNVLIAGKTRSWDFPTLDAFDTMAPVWPDGGDGFVVKMSPSGQLLWATYLGGRDYDSAEGIAVNAIGDAFITGNTRSPDFPSAGELDTTFAGHYDAFVVKVSASGQLLWTRFLGGSKEEMAQAVAVDSTGNVLATGYTWSPDFPVLGDLGTNYSGGWDGFVTKLNGAGELVWSRFLGGGGHDQPMAIAADQLGEVWLLLSPYVTLHYRCPLLCFRYVCVLGTWEPVVQVLH